MVVRDPSLAVIHHKCQIVYSGSRNSYGGCGIIASVKITVDIAHPGEHEPIAVTIGGITCIDVDFISRKDRGILCGKGDPCNGILVGCSETVHVTPIVGCNHQIAYCNVVANDGIRPVRPSQLALFVSLFSGYRIDTAVIIGEINHFTAQ